MQKAGSDLNLALDATQQERERALGLSVGYDAEEDTWELIVRYSGDLERAVPETVSVTRLGAGYAILLVKEVLVDQVAALPEVEYVEKPRRLFFARTLAARISCVTAVRREPLGLTGRGILVAVLDSGVDYRHPEFRNEDGTSRILALWDQTEEGQPPEGFRLGAEYTQEELNQSLARGGTPLSTDESGHGTGVLAIAAGREGIAPESGILAVKLGLPRERGFPRTTELMQGLSYVIRKASELRMPLAVNISFGNTYGSHAGDSLLESYIDDMSRLWKTVICVGSGNEGAEDGHAAGRGDGERPAEERFAVADYEPALSLQLWTDYADEWEIYFVHPSGMRIGPLYARPPAQRYLAGRTELLAYFGEPRPYSVRQEIFAELIPTGDYIDPGIWAVRLVPRRIVDGSYELWLPGSAAIGSGTRFLTPSASNTLTIPSTARRVITVGAYDAASGAYADFSGRGAQAEGLQKPDLAAPGVAVRTAAPQGGYREQTGTSFATPFVTGAAALLMQYGIVDGNDPYLYGEKVKAYLRRGARPLPGLAQYPNSQVGYGALCVRDSLP